MKKTIHCLVEKQFLPLNFNKLVKYFQRFKLKSLKDLLTLAFNYIIQFKTFINNSIEISREQKLNYLLNMKDIIMEELENIDDNDYLELINIL